MKNLLLAATLVLTFLTQPVTADTFNLPSEDPTVSVEIPKAWNPEELEQGVAGESPDQVVTILFEATDEKGVDKLIDENVDWLVDEQKLQIDPKSKATKEFEVGDRTWSRVSWDADSKDWGASVVGFLFTDIGNGNRLTVTYWVTKKDNEKHWGTIEEMLTSVTPLEE